jgi:hypothetical protein
VRGDSRRTLGTPVRGGVAIEDRDWLAGVKSSWHVFAARSLQPNQQSSSQSPPVVHSMRVSDHTATGCALSQTQVCEFPVETLLRFTLLGIEGSQEGIKVFVRIARFHRTSRTSPRKTVASANEAETR